MIGGGAPAELEADVVMMLATLVSCSTAAATLAEMSANAASELDVLAGLTVSIRVATLPTTSACAYVFHFYIFL